MAFLWAFRVAGGFEILNWGENELNGGYICCRLQMPKSTNERLSY